MDEKQNLHAGHRNRMMEKFITMPSAMPDHEILEMLLFAYIPRKNTNGIAHALIRTFGSLEKVFNCTVKELMTIDGVGKSVATALVVNGEIYRRIYANKKGEKRVLFSYAKIKDDIEAYFYGQVKEKFVIFLLDEHYREINKLEYVDHDAKEVTGDIPEIANAFALEKPKYAIIAHNHPSGEVQPSEEDDFATAKLNLLCATHGVTLIDHIIVANNKSFSYHIDKRLEHIKNTYNLENLLKAVKENN